VKGLLVRKVNSALRHLDDPRAGEARRRCVCFCSSGFGLSRVKPRYMFVHRLQKVVHFGNVAAAVARTRLEAKAAPILTTRTPTAPLNGGALSLPLSSIAEQYRHASCVGLAPPRASASTEFTHPSATAHCVPAGTMVPIAARNIWLAS
jgi:hypothetical protein